MKLKASQEQDIVIFTISGPVIPKDTENLKLGIEKLFKNGKNKLILELETPKNLPNDILRELSKFDVLARELSGRVTISGIEDDLRLKIEAFSSPPHIPCYVSRKEALASFMAPIPAREPKIEIAASIPKTTVQNKNKDEAKAAKAELLKIEINQNSTLRRENETLRTENKLLLEQFQGMFMARREIHSEETYKSQIKTLEEQLEDLLKQLQQKGTK